MSSFNPYANKKEAPKESDDPDFKFIKDKDLNMSKTEMKGLVKAMESEEFKNIMGEYLDDISNPKNKAELEEYLKQCEENGELPPNTKLIRPTAGFCLKTTCNKLINRREKKYFEQKTFINITSHEVMDPPKKVERVQNGSRGYTFELPYRVSRGRPDQDNKGEMCTTYDVVFHPEVISLSMLHQGDFIKFVCDTALEGVNKVLANDNEKLSKDYKLLKKLRCKGGQPASITIKVANDNPIINSMDPSKHETSLQKKLTKNSQEAADKRKQDQESKVENDEEEEEAEDDEEELKRIDGISEPKHKIVYSYPVNVEDCWEPPADVLKDRKFPINLRVTINTPFIESTKDADLDINEDTLVFKVPDVYDLMITFKYKVDPEKGGAKFEKDKKRLVIDLPVTGVTEATHDIMKQEKEQFEKNMKRISGGLVQDMDNYTESVSKGFDADFDLEKEVDMEKLNEEALKEDQKEDDSQNFLKVYDESKNQPKEEDEGPKVLDEVKFKEDEEPSDDPIGINPINSGIELVKELPAEEHTKEELQQVKKDLGIPEKKEKECEMVEAMFQQRNELLFYMFQVKGYKEENVKYFVSKSHLYVEHDTEEKLTKSYLEFPKEIDPYETKVKFNVGFINFTLKKESSTKWKHAGTYLSGTKKFCEEDHDLKKHYKSNFIFPPKAESAPVQGEDSDKENKKDIENAEDVKKEEKEPESLQEILEKVQKRQVSHLDLNSSIIFDIY